MRARNEWRKLMVKRSVEIGWTLDRDYKNRDYFFIGEFCPLREILDTGGSSLTLRMTLNSQRSTTRCLVFEVERCMARKMPVFPPNAIYLDSEYACVFDYRECSLLNSIKFNIFWQKIYQPITTPGKVSQPGGDSYH